MPRSVNYKTECEMCLNVHNQENSSIPEGWLNFHKENRFLDRDSTEKFLCPECIESVVKRVKLLRAQKESN